MAKNDKKIIQLTTSGKSKEVIEMLAACKTLVELAPELARLKMCYFKAYISEGFTPEQAIELCKNVATI